MPSLWIDALKQFNHEKGMWCIPRKGSEDYDKVRALMGNMKDAKNKPVKAESPKKAETAKKAESAKKAETAKKAVSSDTILNEVKKVAHEMAIAGKEGGTFQKKENFKGKAEFVKRLNKLFDEYVKTKQGHRHDLFELALKPYTNASATMRTVKGKWNEKSKPSHAQKMYKEHGVNID